MLLNLCVCDCVCVRVFHWTVSWFFMCSRCLLVFSHFSLLLCAHALGLECLWQRAEQESTHVQHCC